MEIENENGALEASFDVLARQEAAEAEIAALKGEVDEVKGRLERLGRASRVPLAGGETSLEVKGFIDGYLRHGRENEVKSIQGTVPGDGGYAVPREIDAAIARQMSEVSPIRRIAQVVQVGSAGYRKLVTLGGTASGWVSETAARPETDTPSFAEIAPPTGELYANPAASQAMLDDAAFDLEAWLASEIAGEFARAEGAAFVNGNGTNRPKGFLASPASMAADAARPFGTLQYIGTADAAGLGGLLRGRGGTEGAALAGHAAGARFVLLDAGPVSLDAAKLGAAEAVAAIGLADPAAVTSAIADAGATLRPLTPVHGRVEAGAEGAMTLRWTRRGRGAWQWADGVDVPLGEQAESYLVGLGPVETPLLRWQVSEPKLDLTAAEWARLAAEHGGKPLWVRQAGSFALSDPLLLTIVS